jgi:formylglycine-generating enzyme required for sulfatase activity
MKRMMFVLLMLGFIFIGCKKEDNPVGNNTVPEITIPDIEMVTVEGGTFMMGETGVATPIHSITLSTFKIAKFEITQKLWNAVMTTNPSEFKGDSLPVENVNWDDIQQFIAKLNHITAKKYRLPTEAEWEYAARGGNQSLGYTYAGSNDINEVAWYDRNSGKTTHPVGTKAPNELGIYDMSGNVMEWCNDWYSNTYYSVSPSTNPQGPSSGTARILRGGSWYDFSIYCASAKRNGDQPINRINILGARLVIEP